ncbi:tudor and KH domain-containing protein-like [Amphiura filiformis]|uniref:tudor and KH domain-containing protein-like n=1 Tax=Amphiura filiformis TaxID=82378 RepID=UPI003B2226B8
MRNQKCYRGDQCPYEHPEPGEDLRDRIPVFYAPTNHSPALPPVDVWVAVEVTSLHNACHFWVQMPWGRTGLDAIQGEGTLVTSGDEDSDGLHALEKSINECCKVKLRTEDPNILRAMGEVVIAKYSRNKRWYRARIIDYDETEPCLKVFYVDYGNAEWLPRADVRTPKPEFLHLPFQAVECFLYGVAPIKEKEDLARRNMEPLVMDKMLVAHVVSSTDATNTMEIQLFNSNGKQDISISQYLLEHNFASATPDHNRVKSLPRSTNRLGRMSEMDEPDSVSCHERQIPG